jgi:hypothetical protein
MPGIPCPYPAQQQVETKSWHVQQLRLEAESMGLDFHGAEMLALARQQKMPMRTVLTLGRQDSLLTSSWLKHLKRVYDAPVEDLGHKVEPHAEAFFKRLGAETVDSLDFSDYQGCTICRDLNAPPPAQQPAQTYDLVYDGGTLEHVFHFPNAIANCMSLVKVGGHFMASLPADQWLGHGFYQFSPELFFRVLSPENGFQIVRIFLAENLLGRGRLVRVIDPAETGVRCLLQTRKPLVLLVWAQKVAEVKPFQSWPKQSDYQTRWEAAAAPGPASTEAPKKSIVKRVRKLAGLLVPDSVKQHLSWRKHLLAAQRGMIELDHLQ